MLKIILSSCIVAAGALLVGCDSSENKGKDEVVANSQAKSDTAIYFRSGAGIDFGIKPFKDVLGVESGNDYRLVTYLFEQSPEEIDKAIKEARNSATIAASLQDKLNWQKTQRELEMKRTKLRRELFDRQDEIDMQRNELIGQLEGQLEQQVQVKKLFEIEWEII